MKRIALSLSFIMLGVCLAAQTLEAVKTGVFEDKNTLIYFNPSTTLSVSITTQKESVRPGPYARFAQKYLGVIAPLTDKDTYTIKLATIEGIESGSVAIAPKPENSTTIQNHIFSDSSFTKVPIDKMLVADKSAEESALNAANTIYLLRKRRIELVTGEQGENVFGAGLQSALREIDRLEQEYMSLFMGKISTQTYTTTINITPDGTKNNYLVARFSEKAGVVASDDLSGRPLMLDLKPDKKVVEPQAVPKGSKGVITYKFAEMVSCRIMDGNKEIVKTSVPIFQYGTEVQIIPHK